MARATTRSAAGAANRRRRKVAQDVTAFKALVASPFDLGTVIAGGSFEDFVMPANGRLAFSCDEELAQGDLYVTVDGREVHNPGGAADSVIPLGFFEADKTLTISRGDDAPGGAISLYVLDEWGRKRAIASGTFS